MKLDYERFIRVEHEDQARAVKGRSFNILVLFFLALLVLVVVILFFHSILDPDSSYCLTTLVQELDAELIQGGPNGAEFTIIFENRGAEQ